MVLYFSRIERTEFGYTTSHVRVWDRKDPLPTVESQIEGCIDNRAGYGSPEAAQRMLARYTYVQQLGYGRCDQTMLHASVAYVELQFQHFNHSQYPEKHYCSARYDVGDELHRIKGGLKLAERLARAERKLFPDAYRMEDPDRLIAVLRHLKAKEVEVIDCDTHGSTGWLYCHE